MKHLNMQTVSGYCNQYGSYAFQYSNKNQKLSDVSIDVTSAKPIGRDSMELLVRIPNSPDLTDANAAFGQVFYRMGIVVNGNKLPAADFVVKGYAQSSQVKPGEFLIEINRLNQFKPLLEKNGSVRRYDVKTEVGVPLFLGEGRPVNYHLNIKTSVRFPK